MLPSLKRGAATGATAIVEADQAAAPAEASACKLAFLG
jgi:hypothetical protein